MYLGKGKVKIKKGKRMNDSKLHKIEISEHFLKHISELTKMSIKVYLSLCYLKYKRGETFTASHREIAINVFDDEDESCYPEYFGIVTCRNAYLKAFNQLEELQLIKRHRSKTKNGKLLPNRYEVY